MVNTKNTVPIILISDDGGCKKEEEDGREVSDPKLATPGDRLDT